MDPLSNVLSLLRPRSYGAGGFDMGGDWSIGFPRHEGFKCYAVASGECWLAMDGLPEALPLRAGDCVLLLRGRPFRLASDLDLAPVPYGSLPRAGGVISNGGGDCLIVGGHFALDGARAGLLLGALSPVVRVRDEDDKAALRWSLERMRQELGERQPGASLIGQHLAHMMLVQALRLHVADGPKGGAGWLSALADRQVSAAIAAVHDDPGHGWTLEGLAGRAGMSRSGFAVRFKALVGETPMEHVTRWRMLLAGDRLVTFGDPVSVVARAVGYASESAFSTAFKRVMGCTPRQYGRDSGGPAIPDGDGVGQPPMTEAA